MTTDEKKKNALIFGVLVFVGVLGVSGGSLELGLMALCAAFLALPKKLLLSAYKERHLKDHDDRRP